MTINGLVQALEFRGLGKPLHVTSDHLELRAEQIPGSVTMDLSNLRLDNVVGPVKFGARTRDVDANDVTNSLELKIDRGDIQVSASKLPLAKMDMHSGNGDITLALPGKADFDLDGRVGAGEVENEFGSPLETRKEGRATTVKGRVGNGPQLTAVTDRGTLSIKKK